MTPYWQDEAAGLAVYLGDAREILPGLADFEAVVTDPPYGIAATRMTLGTGRKAFYRGDWDALRVDVRYLLGAAQWVCIWGGNYYVDQLPISNDWLIWHKDNDGLTFSEAEMAWTNFGCNTRVLRHNWGGETKIHPTQKPLRVMTWALQNCPPVMTVCDPYMGSGTTLVAAKRLGLRAVGIELEERYCAEAVRRLEATTPPLFVLPSEPAVQEGMTL